MSNTNAVVVPREVLERWAELCAKISKNISRAVELVQKLPD